MHSKLSRRDSLKILAAGSLANFPRSADRSSDLKVPIAHGVIPTTGSGSVATTGPTQWKTGR
jgi:hypothetical protein